ncbi:hypothetical protein BMT54_06360 [Pasteurellaceae bacterium 15-036681]|nr:hypothetical protein BMT54_06360 [Pasteurellaceae bacterium 15-036681]
MTMKQIIREMIEQCSGGKSAVAGFLGLTEAQLNNRLYQTKGQRFTDDELIAIELEYGVSHWSDEVNRRLGKVSFVVPNAEVMDNVELSILQLHERAASGQFFAKLDEYIADGVLTDDELADLRRLLHKAQTAKAEMFEGAVVIYKQ